MKTCEALLCDRMSVKFGGRLLRVRLWRQFHQRQVHGRRAVRQRWWSQITRGQQAPQLRDGQGTTSSRGL